MKTLFLFPTASARRFLLLAMAMVMTLGMVSCASNEPKKRKPVTVDEFDRTSNLPWNRPRSFESGGALGRMMPQTR